MKDKFNSLWNNENRIRLLMIIILYFLILLTVIVYMVYFLEPDTKKILATYGYYHPLGLFLIIISALFIISFICFLTVSIRYFDLKLKKSDRKTSFSEYFEGVLEQKSDGQSGTHVENGKEKLVYKDSEKSIIAMMLNTHHEIDEYFKISKNQVKHSFGWSIAGSVLGFSMLIFAAFNSYKGNSDLAAIGIVSGAVTEVVAGTVLWIHNKSAMQLNHYYDALHQNEMFLSVVKITEQLDSDKQNDMYSKIIENQLEIMKITSQQMSSDMQKKDK